VGVPNARLTPASSYSNCEASIKPRDFRALPKRCPRAVAVLGQTRAPRPAASEHCQLMLQCNALPNQCSAGTMMRPSSFNGVAVEPNHWRSPCPTGTIRERTRSDKVLRRDACRFFSIFRLHASLLRAGDRDRREIGGNGRAWTRQ